MNPIAARLMLVEDDWIDDILERDVDKAIQEAARRARRRRMADGVLPTVGMPVWLDGDRGGIVHQVTSLSFLNHGTVDIGASQVSASRLRAAPAGSAVTCRQCDDDWCMAILKRSLR